MTRTRLRRPAALLVAAATLASAPAAAQQEDDEASVYEVRWLLDGLVLTGALGLWAVPQLIGAGSTTARCPCSPGGINALDRATVGNDSRAATIGSDVGVVTLVALPFAFDALDVRGAGGGLHVFIEDALVMAQSIALAGAASQVAKLTVRRPRPRAYAANGDSPILGMPDSYASFFSGHTATAFSATMAYATTFSFRHTDSAARPWVFAGAVATAGTVGALRIVAGAHFPSDVMVGALVGSLSGVGGPWLHRRTPAQVVVAPGFVGLAGRY